MSPRNRLIVPVVALLVIAATLFGSRGFSSSGGESSLERRLLGLSTGPCPDISGTYRLHPHPSSPLGLLEESFLGKGGLRTWRDWPWETMTIASEKDRIVVTLAHSPETMAKWRDSLGAKTRARYDEMMSPEYRWSRRPSASDDDYEKDLKNLFLWPIRSFALRRDADYVCRQGRLLTDIFKESDGTEKVTRGPVETDGEIQVSRDRKGNLVVDVYRKKPLEIPLWCGDGCRTIELWNQTEHHRGQWGPAKAAWVGEVPRPWAAKPPEPQPQPPREPPAKSKYQAFIDSLRPLMPRGVVISNYAIVGQGFRAVFRIPHRDSIAEVKGELAKVAAIESYELLETRRTELGDLEAVMFLKAPGWNLNAYQ